MSFRFSCQRFLSATLFLVNALLFSCNDSDGPNGPVPIIADISPSFGQAGTAVTISGVNFGVDQTKVKIFFTGTSGKQVESVLNGTGSVSGQSILYTTVPKEAVTGKVYVVVNGISGASQINFEVLAPALDLTISPNEGYVNGSMIITGAAFSKVNNENVVTFAGSGGVRVPASYRLSSDGKFLVVNIPGSAASGPVQVAVGKDLYASKENFTVRPCNVSTYAGGARGSVDGSLGTARFAGIGGMAMQSNFIYVADRGNNRIRKIDVATGTVTTLAGSGYGHADGTGSAAQFRSPSGITVGKDGKLYVADTWNQCIRKVDPVTGQVTTVAGVSSAYGNVDAIGSTARLRLPTGITTAADGIIYFTESSDSHRIRRFDPATGAVTTLAGSGTNGKADGTGLTATFFLPEDLIAVGNSLYVSDNGNELIRKIDISTRTVTTLAGGTPQNYASEDGLGTLSSFNSPVGITSDGTYLFVADAGYIRRIDLQNKAVTTLAGRLAISFSPKNGECGSAEFSNTGTMLLTSDGTLYVAELSGFDVDLFLIRKIVL